MKKAAFNPYLPFWETVPDGEPHVFNGRVYIYGSHDRRNGTSFCEDDYVCWSAPVDELGNWRCEGIIYKKEQDPINGAPYGKEMPVYEPSFTGEKIRLLYAPDVTKGPDGRYYLYYALDTANVISVAVCDTPAGRYEFLDYVRCEDGRIPAVGRWFDPAVLCEESGNYLYYGFCPPMRFPGMEKMEMPGGMMVKLADDMHTIISEPICVANGVDTAKGTDYEEHPFFEASSIRKIGEWYYFVYSSLQGHELCYGMAKSPEGPFKYKGVIVSNGDIGYQGNTLPVNYTGNNHGGLIELNGEVYIFWHRHTHGTAFSRQGCADKVRILEDGTIPQIEITSCGLNDGALPARGHYPTYIACHLTEGDRSKVGQVIMSMPGQPLPSLPAEMPYITEEEERVAENCSRESISCADAAKTEYDRENLAGEKKLYPFIHNLCAGAVAGFKYFEFDGQENKIKLRLRGSGKISVVLDSPEGRGITHITAVESEEWNWFSNEIHCVTGRHALYFKVDEGILDFAEFIIQ